MKTTIHNEKLYKLSGACNMCGKCCDGNTKFIYIISDNEVEVKLIENDEPCVSFDNETKKCKVHENKPPICKGFPIVFEELELLGDLCSLKWEFVCFLPGFKNTNLWTNDEYKKVFSNVIK